LAQTISSFSLDIQQRRPAWGARARLSFTVDEETGTMVEPVVVDRVTGALLGTRPLRLARPG
jgi:hypothetical protein